MFVALVLTKPASRRADGAAELHSMIHLSKISVILTEKYVIAEFKQH